MRYDEVDRERDELAARLRERDHHREPRRSWRAWRPLSRWAFQAHVIDRFNEIAQDRGRWLHTTRGAKGNDS